MTTRYSVCVAYIDGDCVICVACIDGDCVACIDGDCVAYGVLHHLPHLHNDNMLSSLYSTTSYYLVNDNMLSSLCSVGIVNDML
jgi:hypothetical protein